MVKVKEVMKKDVITVPKEATVEEIAKIMTNNRIGSLVVVEKGNKLQDIVTESDVTSAIAKGLDPKTTRIADFKKNKIKKRTKLISVSPEDNVLQVTKIMVKNGVKRVPVVEGGKLRGILADKEILLISPELIEIMSEKLKNRVSMVPSADQTISGLCEDCGGYSDELEQSGNRWVCPECKPE